MKNNPVKISVVIPAHNEEKFIKATLDSLIKQDFKEKFEIIVVDNNSSDKTSEIAKSYGAKVVFESRPGIVFARQAGFNIASSEIIVSTDADTILPSDWLSKIYSTFKNRPKIVGITGFYELYGAKSPKTVLINLFLPIVKNLSWFVAKKGYFLGSNFAIKKSVFNKIGGFNPNILWGEDVEIGMRARREGEIVLKYDLKVITSARRYESLKILELFKLNILSFLSIMFLNKPYVGYFKHVRDSHDSSVSVNRLKRLSQIMGAILIGIFIFGVLFYGLASPKSQIMGKTYWHSKTKEKVIALTFDDGPNEPYTSEILDILKQENIHATFFVLGENAKYYPGVVKKEYDNGNVVGNHSYSHLMLLSLEDNAKMSNQISSTQDEIYKIINQYPHLFRPPHGYKTPFLLGALKKNNLVPIEWSDMTYDYYKPGVAIIVHNIMSKVKPGGIIVMHDGDKTIHGSNRAETVAALKIIISRLKNKGYKFVTVNELLKIPAYN